MGVGGIDSRNEAGSVMSSWTDSFLFVLGCRARWKPKRENQERGSMSGEPHSYTLGSFLPPLQWESRSCHPRRCGIDVPAPINRSTNQPSRSLHFNSTDSPFLSAPPPCPGNLSSSPKRAPARIRSLHRRSLVRPFPPSFLLLLPSFLPSPSLTLPPTPPPPPPLPRSLASG